MLSLSLSLSLFLSLLAHAIPLFFSAQAKAGCPQALMFLAEEASTVKCFSLCNEAALFVLTAHDANPMLHARQQEAVALAEYCLGQFYEEGEVIAANVKKAEEW